MTAESAQLPRTALTGLGTPPGSPLGSPTGSPLGSPLGPPAGSPVGSPLGSPAGSGPGVSPPLRGSAQGAPAQGTAVPARSGARPIAKAAQILDAFTPAEPWLTLAELSHRTGLVPSTALRRTADLLSAGLLERLPDGRFYLSTALHRLAAAAPTGASLSTAALPVMREVFATTGFDVELTVRSGRFGVVLERLHTPGRQRVEPGPAALLPLQSTAAGLTLLAGLPRERRESLLRDPAPPIGQLAEIRAKGHARMDHGAHPCTSEVAAPILDAGGCPVAALSLARGFDGAFPREMPVIVSVAARAIARQLPGTPHPQPHQHPHPHQHSH